MTLVEALQKDVTNIKERLEEGDKDLVILRFSRCLIERLDRYGIIKCILLALTSASVGYLWAN